MMPPRVKYNPFLKIELFGINIQKEDSTKNNSESPKKILRKNSGLFEFALCSLVILSKTNGSDFVL